MPRTGDTYALPAGGAVAGTEAKAGDVTTPLADLAAEQNLVRPISAGGTGGATAAAARTELGLEIGTDVQAFGAVLDDLNTLGANAADGEFLVGTGAGALAWEKLAVAITSLGLHKGSFFATYGGTANAITLTTGLSLSALTTGQEFRFVPTANNTAASTAAIDGLEAIDIVTADGSATPADYLINGHACIGRIDANGDLRVRWETMHEVTDANGTCTKWDTGRMECVSPSLGSSIGGMTGTWTFPGVFSSAPAVPGCVCRVITGGVGEGEGVVGPNGNSAISTTAFSWRATKVAGTGTNARYIYLNAIGRWY